MRVTNFRTEKTIAKVSIEKCLQSRKYIEKKQTNFTGKSMRCTRHSFSLVFSFVAVLRLSISPCLQKLQTIQ